MKDYSRFFTEFQKKTVAAIIEQVRDSQFVMILEVLLLPSYHSISFAISGVKVSAHFILIVIIFLLNHIEFLLQFLPESEDFKEEAKFSVECRLLQQDDIQVVFERSFNNYVSGSVLHPVCSNFC